MCHGSRYVYQVVFIFSFSMNLLLYPNNEIFASYMLGDLVPFRVVII